MDFFDLKTFAKEYITLDYVLNNTFRVIYLYLDPDYYADLVAKNKTAIPMILKDLDDCLKYYESIPQLYERRKDLILSFKEYLQKRTQNEFI